MVSLRGLFRSSKSNSFKSDDGDTDFMRKAVPKKKPVKTAAKPAVVKPAPAVEPSEPVELINPPIIAPAPSAPVYEEPEITAPVAMPVAMPAEAPIEPEEEEEEIDYLKLLGDNQKAVMSVVDELPNLCSEMYKNMWAAAGSQYGGVESAYSVQRKADFDKVCGALLHLETLMSSFKETTECLDGMDFVDE